MHKCVTCYKDKQERGSRSKCFKKVSFDSIFLKEGNGPSVVALEALLLCPKVNVIGRFL